MGNKIKSIRAKNFIEQGHVVNRCAFYDTDGHICNSMIIKSMYYLTTMIEEDMEDKFFDIINAIFTNYSVPQESSIRADIDYLLNN